jgi:hypothetical protein
MYSADTHTVITEIVGKFSEQTTALATKADLAEVKGDLKSEIKGAKVDTIKWLIAMFAIQTATILGFLYFMLKH